MKSVVSHLGSPAGLLVATVLTLGCGEAPRISDAVTVRDSAGIEIIQKSEPGAAWAEGEGWELSERPRLDLGRLGGEEATQFHDVRGAVRLSGGRVVVANGGTGELRFFGPEGEHLLTTGGGCFTASSVKSTSYVRSLRATSRRGWRSG